MSRTGRAACGAGLLLAGCLSPIDKAVDCPAGQTLVEERCEVVCVDDAQCAAAEYCLGGACYAAFCGDNLVQDPEECDDGAAANADGALCTSLCMVARCGDGLLWDGVEACDDGNTLAGDGCSPYCTVELTCSPAPELCDGLDNDCDSAVDEDCPCPFLGNAVGVCAQGALDQAGFCRTPLAFQAVEATCDDLDNDCDGLMDENCRCDYLASSAGVCPQGGLDGQGVCLAPIGFESVEATCDERDNDCDGLVDEDCACAYQGIALGVCGEAHLDGGGLCVVVDYEAEEVTLHDGLDNDCDGVIDECGGPMLDARDGQRYETVAAGAACWMADNLNVGQVLAAAQAAADDGQVQRYCNGDVAQGCRRVFAEYREHDLYAGFNIVCLWTVQAAYVEMDSPDASGLGACYIFKSFRRSDIDGRTLAVTWASDRVGGATNSVTLSLLDGKYDAADAAQFPTDAPMAAQGAGSLGALGSDPFPFSQARQELTPQWQLAQQDWVTVMVTRPDSHSSTQYYMDLWSLEVVGLATFSFAGAVLDADVTGTLGDYGRIYAEGTTPYRATGGLYQWDEAMDYGAAAARGICPTGWHLPSDAEWRALEETLGMCAGAGAGCSEATGARGTVQGAALKENGDAGFEAVLGGQRSAAGSIALFADETAFWTATEGGSQAWARRLRRTEATVTRELADKAMGLAVRCVRD